METVDAGKLSVSGVEMRASGGCPDGERGGGSPVQRLRQRIAQLERRLFKLERSVSRQTEDLLFDLDAVREEAAALPAGLADETGNGATRFAEETPQPRPAGRHNNGGPRQLTDEEKVLGELALTGANRCDVSSSADGTWWVHLDEHAPFTIAPALARLLAVLCEDNGASDDHLVGWKTMAEVARRLRKRDAAERGAARPRELVDPKREAHCIRQSLYRLRLALLAQHVNHKLVMVSRPLGARFARRHNRGARDGR
jgi:hypothetical protein